MFKTNNFFRMAALSFLAAAVFTMQLSARGAGETSSVPEVSSIEITDHFGRTVTLDKPAEKIVSLSPAITETVFALGYGERLAGRTDYCDYPPEAASVPALGSLMEPDIEAIAAINPDIVIASTHFPKEALEKLENANLKVVVLMGQESFEGTYNEVIMPVAEILGDKEAGEKIVASMKATVDKALAEVKTFTKTPTLYYVVGFGEGGDWTAGGDTFIGKMIEMAGAENIAKDVKGWSFSKETLVEKDPDIIIVPGWAKDVFPVTPVYSDLKAVKNGHVYTIDENTIVRQGPRLADGFASLVEIVAKAAR